MEYYQAYNGRKKVYDTIYGDDVKSYSQLVWYINAIRETNPGYQFCRPMVYLDATFLTGRFIGCLMAATGINGDKGFFSLAMALVDSENNDNWEWFLINPTQVVGDGRPITFHSDPHDGLLRGVPLVYPDSFHSLCYYHLKTNLPINGSNPRYTLVLDHFQEATYALSPENHAKDIRKIRYLNYDWVADCIETILPESYANAFFQGCRYGRISSNLAESFNSGIKVHKKMPAFALLDQIRMKVMKKMAKHRAIGDSMMTPLTPEYEKRLESLEDEGLSWQVALYGFSCAHALADIRKIKREAIDFISPPVDIDEDNTINPPIIKTQPGRPQGKKIIIKGEMKPKRKVHCRNCKEAGQNRAGCKNPLKFASNKLFYFSATLIMCKDTYKIWMCNSGLHSI
ncbi:uncharacterized protein LOC113352569 [Papaver somniferum]|uniref:uncharacterized protein LOC113352569 n=1 Tax=Papaver somniferum TaxID=3469 RepID=UPI000E6F8FC9|nr:uncharacterized protein LOC113352569 [Papaver somniferum]